MGTGLHVVFGLLAVFTIAKGVESISTVEIKHVTSKVITSEPTTNVRDIELAFDNDDTTQALVHSEVNSKVYILISLPREYEVDSVEIITDLPSSLKQTIQIGYAQDISKPSPSLAYQCSANRTATLCQPHCGLAKQGVVGQTILWSFERISESGWTRIYDVIIRGRLFDEQVVIRDKVADIALLKPYWDHSVVQETGEQCDLSLWKLTDSSSESSTQPPQMLPSHNMTIYFGQTYSVSKVSLIINQADEQLSEIALHFGGKKDGTKTLILSTDCSVEQAEKATYTCTLNDLAGYPFTNVTFSSSGLVKIHIYGMPFFYPQIGLLTSEKSSTPESHQQLQLTCVAVTCGSTIVAQLKAQMQQQTASSCSRYGHTVECADLELLRLRIPITHEPTEPNTDTGTVLVSKGAVVDDVAKIMTELRVINSSNSELVVSMPRTYHYYGQYKCRCLADDTIGSTSESQTTHLTPDDFDRDFVFQRNYTAQIDKKSMPAKLGFLELVPNEESAFFRLMIEGHSLTDKLGLNTTYSESGNLISITGDYAQTSVVEAFPRTPDSQQGWPIPAYKVSLQEAWPDVTDGEAITVEWTTTDSENNVRVLKDSLRTIVLSPEKDGHVRSWVWQRDNNLLDIRAYYQIGQNGEQLTPERIYLQRSGCLAGSEPERISTVLLSGSTCEAEDGTDKVTVLKTQSGCIIQFKISDPSSTDQYTLYKESKDDTPATQIITSPRMTSNLQSEIDTADIAMKFLSIEDDPNAGTSKLNILVTVHSKAIVDSSKCQPIHLSLHPMWPVDQPLVQRIQHSDTPFTFVAPHDQKLLSIDLELRVESNNADSPELRSRRSLTIPHPMAYRTQLRVDNTKNDVVWDGVPAPFNNMLEEFQVKVSGLTRACGTNIDFQTPKIYEDKDKLENYRIRLTDIPEVSSNPNLLVDFTVLVTPVFKGTGSEKVHGFQSSINFTRGHLGQTTLKADESVNSRDKRIFVSPSQMTSCLKDAPFLVAHELQVDGEGETTKPSYLEQVTFEEDSASLMTESGRWYVIKNLQPGRKYSVKASVQYVTGDKDYESASESFWTKDEISVTTVERVASPGEYVTANCTAAVGPPGEHQKRVSWKRQDGTPLPDGGRTEVVSVAEASSGWTETLSLIFDKVEQGQASTYGCFVEPSVEQAVGMPTLVPTFKLTVSELQLDMDFKVAAVDESVSVRCQSGQADNLVWLDTKKQTLPAQDQSENDDPYVKVEPSPDGGIVSTLHIPYVKLAQTGDYTCTYPATNSQRIFRLRLRKEISLSWETNSSPKSGETLKLSCIAKPSQQGDQLVWYLSRPDSKQWVPVSTLLETDPSIDLSINVDEQTTAIQSTLEIIQSPNTNGQFYCTLQPPNFDTTASITEHPESNAGIMNVVQPVIHVQKMESGNSQEVLAQCRGYPAHESDRLHWVFLPEGNQSRAIPISQSALAEPVSDEVVSAVQSTFRLGDTSPAAWPGASGPELLTMSRNVDESIFKPETVELIVHKPDGNVLAANSDLLKGFIACQYRRPKSVIVMEGSIPMYATDKTDHSVIIQKELAVSKLIDPTTPVHVEENPPVAAAGSGIVAVKSESEDGNKANSRINSPLILNLLFMATLFYWNLL